MPGSVCSILTTRSRADSAHDSVARGARDLRGRVPAPPQRRALRPRPLSRLSGAPRARRAGGPHRRDASRSHRTESGPKRRCARARNGSSWRSPARRRASGTGISRPAPSCTPRAGSRCSATRDDEIEPHISAWERLLHPDDWPRARQVQRERHAAAPTYEGEFRLRHKDGHYVHVLSRGYPVRREPGGPVVRIVGTHFDLTDAKQAEAERARTELLARLVFAQEDERRRIAREMHDQFGEQLTALALRESRVLKDACGADRRSGARTWNRSKRSRSASIATSITWSGSFDRQRSTTSACARRSRTTSRTGRIASASAADAAHVRPAGRSARRRTPKPRSTASRRKRSPMSRSTRAPRMSTSSSSGAPITSC